MLDAQELELLAAFENGQLKSIATKSELARLVAAARHRAREVQRPNKRPLLRKPQSP
jgi:hypothetical protein